MLTLFLKNVDLIEAGGLIEVKLWCLHKMYILVNIVTLELIFTRARRLTFSGATTIPDIKPEGGITVMQILNLGIRRFPIADGLSLLFPT